MLWRHALSERLAPHDVALDDAHADVSHHLQGKAGKQARCRLEAPAVSPSISSPAPAKTTTAHTMDGSGWSSSKRRSRDESDLDLEASLSALTTKLGGTTTQDKDGLVATICEVIGVSPETAAFYLDAANNDPHAAVHLHVQSSGGGGASTQLDMGKRSRASFFSSSSAAFKSQQVQIAGLPSGWTARVSTAGTIVFVHEATGREQPTIPPAFGEEMEVAAAAPGTSSVDEVMSLSYTDDATGELTSLTLSPHAAPSSPPQLAKPAHSSSEPEHPNPDHHRNVTCDACNEAVRGIRYQCLTRHNFDLCERCMWAPTPASEALRSGHSFMKMSFVHGR